MSTLLYNRTSFSLLESSITLKQLKNHCEINDFKSIAICDKNVLFASNKFFKEFKDTGIKPIYGMEIESSYKNEKVSLLLFAKNNNGFLNLAKISYQVNINELSLEETLKIISDCYIIINDNSTLFNKIYLEQSEITFHEILENFKNRNDVYIGYSKVSTIYKEKHDELLIIASRYNIRPVAISLALYSDVNHFDAYKTLKAIKSDKNFDDPSLEVERERQLLSKVQLDQFPKEAIENTDYISDNCNVDFSYEKATLPRFICPEGYDEKKYLKALCLKGLNKRLNNQVDDVHLSRLNYELNIIISLNFANYFLIIYDLVLYATRKGILTSVRGSAVGSLVAYCLGITNIDPLKYDLLFERFLNSQRATMPDIDLDVSDEQRGELINYLHDKYNHDKVAHIITFSSFKTKQAIIDTAKVLNFDTNIINQLKKAITDNLSINELINTPEIIRLIEMYPNLKKLLKISSSIENLPKAISIHAGGIVLSSDSINRYIPVIEHESFLTTQFTMESLEDFGLIKFDLLGLTNLTHISKVYNLLDNIKINYDFNDKKTYEIFAKNHVLGIFQCESAGMRALLKRISPRSINELSACIALFRPGPKRFIDEYVARKEGKKPITYLHKDLEPILKETFGIVIYQEQVMKIAQIIAGFNLNKADLLRKAISKKNSDEFAKLKIDFINGCIVKGNTKEFAESIFDYLDKFAEYGFNKSHSYAYAEFAFKMAYLKVHYPLQFYKVMFDLNIGRDDIIKNYTSEMKERGLNLYSVDINHSDTSFTICADGLRLPLTQVKTINTNIASQLIENRNELEFKDYVDFVLRAKNINLTNENIKMLISAGALDCFNKSRLSMSLFIDDDLETFWKLAIFNENGTVSKDSEVFNDFSLKNINDNELVRIEKEKEALGFYYSKHPLSIYKKKIGNVIDLASSLPKNTRFNVLVSIRNIKEYVDKNHNVMAFIEAFDDTASFDFVIMSKEYAQNKESIIINRICLFECELSDRNSILIKKAIEYNYNGGNS